MSTVNVGVIGCGRTAGLARYLSEYNGVAIKGAYDPNTKAVEKMFKNIGLSDGTIYNSYEQLVEDPELQWVMVGSPNKFHREQIVAAFENGKHVFAEKPLATTIEDCVAIKQAHQKSGKLFATGFCMRYIQMYREAKELFDSGILGTIVSIDGNENINPGHGAYIMANWRRNKDICGPHILEKCVHDLDILNWITESIPHRVAAFGGNDMFIEKNKHILEKSRSFYRLQSEWDPGINPFTVEKTIEDNIVAILEYYNGIRVQFQATTCNIIPERRLYCHCTEGNLIVGQYAAILKYQPIGDDKPTVIEYKGQQDSKGRELEANQKLHVEGDKTLVKELADSMKNNTPPKCSGVEGLLSAIAAIMIDKAREQGQVLDLTETWKSIGVDIERYKKRPYT